MISSCIGKQVQFLEKGFVLLNGGRCADRLGRRRESRRGKDDWEPGLEQLWGADTVLGGWRIAGRCQESDTRGTQGRRGAQDRRGAGRRPVESAVKKQGVCGGDFW